MMLFGIPRLAKVTIVSFLSGVVVGSAHCVTSYSMLIICRVDAHDWHDQTNVPLCGTLPIASLVQPSAPQIRSVIGFTSCSRFQCLLVRLIVIRVIVFPCTRLALSETTLFGFGKRYLCEVVGSTGGIAVVVTQMIRLVGLTPTACYVYGLFTHRRYSILV